MKPHNEVSAKEKKSTKRHDEKKSLKKYFYLQPYNKIILLLHFHDQNKNEKIVLTTNNLFWNDKDSNWWNKSNENDRMAKPSQQETMWRSCFSSLELPNLTTLMLFIAQCTWSKCCTWTINEMKLVQHIIDDDQWYEIHFMWIAMTYTVRSFLYLEI